MKTSWVIACKPLGATMTLTSANELPFKLAPIIAPDLSSNPVSGFTMTRSGITV